MATAKKCANPACSCVPQDGAQFCGAHCEAVKGATEVMCQCGHASCAAVARPPASQVA